MTVAQFQRINEINETTPDSIEQLGWMVCEVFGLTHDEVDSMSAKKFEKHAAKLQRMMQRKEPKFFRIPFETDATKITFGQFIEVQYWLRQSLPAVLDLVAASILIDRTDHKADAAWLRDQPLRKVLPPVQRFNDSLNELVASYKGLFDNEETEEEDEQVRPMRKGPDIHPFIEQYGWIYSATEVAQHEGIKLDEAYALPVIQALNDLSYLKSKQQYNKHLSKK